MSRTRGSGGLRHFSLKTLWRFPVVRRKMKSRKSRTQLHTANSRNHMAEKYGAARKMMKRSSADAEDKDTEKTDGAGQEVAQ